MLAVAGILICFLGGCRTINITESSIFAPVVLANPLNDSGFQEISIANGSSPSLNGIHLSNPTAHYCLVYLHGNSGSIWDREEFKQIEFFQKHGFDVFSVDYQGYGKSLGKPSLDNVYKDSEATYAYAKAHTSLPIIVYGFSLGSAAAIRIGKVEAPQGLILESTIDDPAITAQFFKKHLKLPMRWLININTSSITSFTSRQDATQVRSPVLMLHGQQDETAPLPLAKQFFQVLGSSQKKLVEFPKAKHNTLFETDSILYRKAIAEFVKK